MSLMDMQEAEIVSPADAPDQKTDDTMLVPRKGSRSMWLLALVAALAILGGIVGVIYHFASGSAPDATQAEAKPEAQVDTDAVTISAGWKADCQGDLSRMTDRQQYYCGTIMPAMQKLSDSNVRLSTELKERGQGNRPIWPWILIALLGVNSLVCWILLIRRRRKAS